MDLREQILDTATQLFRTHGLNFTMQQVASSLHISKKTIYTVYPGKEALLTDMVDMLFAKIHQKKSELAAGTDPLEKRLYAVLTALPEEYAALDFRRLDELEEISCSGSQSSFSAGNRLGTNAVSAGAGNPGRVHPSGKPDGSAKDSYRCLRGYSFLRGR